MKKRKIFKEQKQPSKCKACTFKKSNLLVKYFLDQLSILQKLENKCEKLDASDRILSLSPLLFSLSTAGKSFALLSEKLLITESFIIARAFLERITNLCYFLICDDKEYKNFLSYSRQKAFRSLHREIAVGNVCVTAKLEPPMEPSLIPGMEEALLKFTSAKGKEKTRFDEIRLEKKIEFIQKTIEDFRGDIYLVALLFIYDDASESIHGTLHGTLFPIAHYGIGLSASKTNYQDKLIHYVYTLSMLLGQLIEGLLRVINSTTPVTEMLREATINRRVMLKHFSDKGGTVDAKSVAQGKSQYKCKILTKDEITKDSRLSEMEDRLGAPLREMYEDIIGELERRGQKALLGDAIQGCFDEVFELFLSDIATNSENNDRAYYCLGNLSFLQLRFNQARACYENALAQCPEQPVYQRLIALSNNEITESHRSMKYYDRISEVMRKVFGNDNTIIGTILNNIGLALFDLGEYERSIRRYEQSLDILRKRLGNNHLRVARVLANIGPPLIELGEFDKAMVAYDEALSICRGAANAHEDISRILFNLGSAHMAQGNESTALKHYLQSHEEIRKKYDESHPTVRMITETIKRKYKRGRG